MRIAHISVGDAFTAKWVHAQARLGDDVHLIMLKTPKEQIENVCTYVLPFHPPYGYYMNVFSLKRLLKKINPDLLHVHYATGHGTLGRLVNFRPTLLSVWGSDVLLAPQESSFMRRRVIKNLRHYDAVCCTSTMLTQAVKDLCPFSLPLHQIPIGVETNLFSPCRKKKENPYVVVGTVKSLQPVYGIDILLHAFARAKKILLSSREGVGIRLKLKIIGDGFWYRNLVKLTTELGLSEDVEFKGYIPNHEVPHELHQMDIFMALSRSESFGVSVVEASACGLPVIVTNVGGLPEVVQKDDTGFIVERDNPEDAARAIVKLATDAALRKRMGNNGRRFVQSRYEWSDCLRLMYNVYQKMLLQQSFKEKGVENENPVC